LTVVNLMGKEGLAVRVIGKHCRFVFTNAKVPAAMSRPVDRRLCLLLLLPLVLMSCARSDTPVQTRSASESATPNPFDRDANGGSGFVHHVNGQSGGSR